MKPYILITNDDGIDAPGIKELTAIMRCIGDVIVVAPDGPRSGMSNALTVGKPIVCKHISSEDGYTLYSCSGTPTDCIKIAFEKIVIRKPDLVVSGINHGSNAAINVIYSGTMGAALEGCEKRVPAIGFSLCDHSIEADFSCFTPFIFEITKKTLQNGLPESVCLNVNAPKGEIKGIRVSKQCRGEWVKEIESTENNEFVLSGHFENYEPNNENTDEWALANGYISVVPTKTDMTAYEIIDKIKDWKI